MKKLWNVLTLVVMTVMMPLAAHALAGPVDPPPVPAMSGDNLEPPAQAALTAANSAVKTLAISIRASPAADGANSAARVTQENAQITAVMANKTPPADWRFAIKDDPHIV